MSPSSSDLEKPSILSFMAGRLFGVASGESEKVIFQRSQNYLSPFLMRVSSAPRLSRELLPQDPKLSAFWLLESFFGNYSQRSFLRGRSLSVEHKRESFYSREFPEHLATICAVNGSLSRWVIPLSFNSRWRCFTCK